MFRKPRYRKGNMKKWAAFALVLAVGWGLWRLGPLKKSFDPQELVTNSELRAKKFALPAEEISSPIYGIKAYLMEDKANPIISLSFSFNNAGYAGDNPNQQGVSQLVAALLTEGAGGYDGQSLKEELEDRAIKIGFAITKDDFNGSMLTTKDNADKAAELLRLMLLEPRFEMSDLERVKAQVFEALKRQGEHPAEILQLEFNRELFGGHPYSRNPLGKAEDIIRLQPADLQRFAKDNFTRGNLLVGIAGDVNAAEAGQMLDEIFGDLPASGRVNFVRNAEVVFDGRMSQIQRDSGQNIVYKALLGVSRNDEDFYPLFVANYIFGGAGLTSKLSQQIREKEGLTYGVYSYLSLGDKAPLLVFGFASTADKFARADELLMAETEEFQRHGVTAEELQKAKDYLTASYNLRFASIENIAEILTAMQKYNLGLDFLQKRNDYILNLELQRVNQAAAKYFNKNQMVGVKIGNFDNEFGGR